MPLSPKQQEIVNHAVAPETTLLAAGAIRSGKTVSMCAGYAGWSQTFFPHNNHVIVGTSQDAVLRNVVEADLGLDQCLRAFGYETTLTYAHGLRLIVHRHDGRDTNYWIMGASDSRARRRIQGLTVAGALIDEVALIPEDFVMAVWGRLSIDGAKLWLNCNPEGSGHYVKKQFIDRKEHYRCKVVDFRLDDNPSLSEEVKDRLAGGLSGHWRKRMIEGEWADPTGLVYPAWDHIHEGWSIDYAKSFALGYDHGPSGVTATVLIATTVGPDGNDIKIVAGERYYDVNDGRVPLTDDQHADAIASWVRGTTNTSRLTIYGDPSTPRPMQRLLKDKGFVWVNGNNDVLHGLSICNSEFTNNRLLLSHDVPKTEGELSEYRWDEKAIERGEDMPVKHGGHALDCFDDQTDVLTSRGWLRFKDASNDDAFATVNLERDEIEYQRASALIDRPHDGEMIAIKNQKLDILVTPGHRMVVYPRQESPSAAEPRIVEARDLTLRQRIKIKTANWGGTSRNEPVQVKIAYGRDAAVDPHVWAEFLGWYIAEGCVSTAVRCPGHGHAVHISQKDGTDGKAALDTLLAKTPWNWNYGGHSFYTSCKWLREYLLPLGKVDTKCAPEWITQSDPSIIDAFLRGAIAGDGWMQRGLRRYATTSPRLADQIQEMFIKTGSAASVRRREPGGSIGTIRGKPVKGTKTQYWVMECKTATGHMRDYRNNSSVSATQYDGRVYCATVPNGTLIVRRSGKPFVAGNCVRYVLASKLREFGRGNFASPPGV